MLFTILFFSSLFFFISLYPAFPISLTILFYSMTINGCRYRNTRINHYLINHYFAHLEQFFIRINEIQILTEGI